MKKTGSILIQYALIFLGITMITFFLLHISPGNPAQIWLTGGDGNVGQVSEEAIRIQEAKMGLDQPFIIQYGRWLGKAVQGDLGTSMQTGRPVIEELAMHMEPTIVTATTAVLLMMLIAIPLGILCAIYKNQWIDKIVRVIAFLGISTPSFLNGLLILWIFCLKFGWFSIIAESGWRGYVLPIVVLTFQCSTRLVRRVRALILEQLQEKYIQGAIARGVDKKRILLDHVLKNALPPILTWCAIEFGVLLGGAVVVESIFSLRGIGKLALDAIQNRDYFLVQGFVLWSAVAFLMIQLFVEILGKFIDPRLGTEEN